MGRPWFWVLLLVAAWLPFMASAQTVTITPATPANPQDFGSVAVGQNSASKSYSVTATNINRDVVVVIPAGFQGSTDNTAFSSSNITFTLEKGNDLSGTFYIRFAPTQQKSYSEFLSATSRGGSGAVISNEVELIGTGAPGAPTITVNPNAIIFGNTIIGSTSAPQSFTVNATSLGTTPITVTAPTEDYLVSYNGSPYASTATIPVINGSVSAQNVNVVFKPTASSDSRPKLITLTSTTASTSVSVAGTAVAPAPTLSVNPTSLPDFGQINIGQASGAESFVVTGNNLTGNVTITAPANFQIRVPGGTFSTANITLTGSTINQQIEVRFQPTSTGNKTGVISVSTNGAPTVTVQVSGNGRPAPVTPIITANPTSLDFGQISASGSAQTLTFEVGATNLTAPLVLTGSNANIAFRDASVGGSFTAGPLTINPVGGTVSLRNIEVRLVATVASGAFTGSITASSTGATPVVVNITANNNLNGSSTINTTGELQQFSTVPGVPSAVQSYLVAASNLLQDVTVTAPQYFQVSLTSDFTGITGTGNTVIVARNSGNDIFPAVRVYVRFIPPVAITTSDLVTNTSSPATGQGIPVSGTSVPSIQVLNAFQEIRNIIIYTTSASQTLNVRADRVRQPITITRNVISNSANPSNTAQFELSLDNVTFSNSVTLTPTVPGYSVSAQIYVRYRPTYLGDAQSILQYQSSDFAIQTVQDFSVNGQLSARSIDIEPTLRSTPTVTRSGSTATVSFNLPANYAGLGYGENRLVVASTNPTLPAGSQPADGTPYGTGNQTYGSGPQVVPGYYVVYSGDESVVTVSGLNPAVTYYIYTFEFNNIESSINVAIVGAENYLQPPVPTSIQGIIAPGTPLPVDLVSFTAKLRNNKVSLNWVTASEKNNGSFAVERSQDARTFTTILTREGKGTTSTSTTYDAIDEKPLTGTSYYRLKQIDFDGTVKYSSPVAVNNLGVAEVTMYPNPTEDVLNIQIGGSTEGVRASVSDLTGRVVLTQVLSGNGQLSLGGLRSGTYLVTVGEGNSKVTRRIVKK